MKKFQIVEEKKTEGPIEFISTKGRIKTSYSGASVGYEFEEDSEAVELEINEQYFSVSDLDELIDFIEVAKEYLIKKQGF